MDRRTLGIAAVVLVVAGLVAGLLFGAMAAGGLPGIAGTASPTPAPATVFTTTQFTPATTVTIPSNWAPTGDGPDAFQISPLVTDGKSSPAPTDVAGIYLFRDARAALQDPACTMKPDATVAADAKSIATWLSQRPGLTATAPDAVTIGGLSGWEVEAEIAPTWTSSCPFANGAPTVAILANDSGTIRWVMFGSEKLRVAFLDLPGGGTIAVNRSVNDKVDFPGFINETDPIVASMRFATR